MQEKINLQYITIIKHTHIRNVMFFIDQKYGFQENLNMYLNNIYNRIVIDCDLIFQDITRSLILANSLFCPVYYVHYVK